MSAIITNLVGYLVRKFGLPLWLAQVLTQLVNRAVTSIGPEKVADLEGQVKHAILAFILRGKAVPVDENGCPLDAPRNEPWYQYDVVYDPTKPDGGIAGGRGMVLSGAAYDPTLPGGGVGEER